MRWGLLVVAVAGCNGAFDLDETQLDTRPDRDADGIPDEDDDCIAAPDDLAYDADADTIANRDDSCGLLFNDGVDSDGDGVDNACDILPAMAGDRHRCTNTFRESLLTVSFFVPRAEQDFAIARGFIIGPPGADIVAAEPLVPATGTSTFDAITASVADNQTYTMALLVSAGDVPSSSDLACMVVAGQNSTMIGVIGATQRIASPPDVPRSNEPIYMRAIFQPGKSGDNIICGASYGSNIIVAVGHYDGPVQHQGFWVPEGGALIAGYTINVRDDQPAIPGF
jgi:hypothetical protein